MVIPSLEAIRELTEKIRDSVKWLAEILRGRDWLTKLVLVDVVMFLFLNPDVYPMMPTLYQSLRGRPLPTFYPLGFWALFGAIAMAAFVVALRTKQSESRGSGIDPAPLSAIKGLRPCRFDDAPLFTRLQRDALVRECAEVLTDPEFRFGILYGPSGCGKTSFLRAGLWPRLSAPEASHCGVTIRKFEPGSNGQRLGLEVGDLFFSYNGEDISNEHVFSELELVRGERRRELRIQRQGQEVTVELPPGRLQGLDLVDRIPLAFNKAGL